MSHFIGSTDFPYLPSTDCPCLATSISHSNAEQMLMGTERVSEILDEVECYGGLYDATFTFKYKPNARIKWRFVPYVGPKKNKIGVFLNPKVKEHEYVVTVIDALQQSALKQAKSVMEKYLLEHCEDSRPQEANVKENQN